MLDLASSRGHYTGRAAAPRHHSRLLGAPSPGVRTPGTPAPEISSSWLEKSPGRRLRSWCHDPHGSSREGSDATMKVWIDQDLCTGDGLCEEIAPTVFTLLDDGLAYVKEGDKVFSDPGGAEGLANIPDGMLDAVVESAEECPGECIFIEAE